jgi:23S rRNA (guanosine2251-2'-O)-methyltransferase
MPHGRTTAARRKRRSDDAPLVVYGTNAVRELLASEAPVARVSLERAPRIEPLRHLATARGIPVDLVERVVLDRLAGSPHHQGAVAVAPPFRYAALERVLAAECTSALVLDGVQDPRNLGAILRTARAFGVGAVVLARDRSTGVTPVVVSASAGLVFGLRIAQVPNLVRAMEALKAAGFWLVGLAPRDGTPIDRFEPPSRPALVAGGEGEGLRALVARSCDFTVTIPMAAGVESLNVSVAVGVALHAVMGRRTPI